MTVMKAKRFRIRGGRCHYRLDAKSSVNGLEQMVSQLQPGRWYTALINQAHQKSYLPDSTFNRYGKVTALCLLRRNHGKVRWQGKMALYADVEPAESPVELVKKGQKLFTSMEVSPKFADTGRSYLSGSALPLPRSCRSGHWKC